MTDANINDLDDDTYALWQKWDALMQALPLKYRVTVTYRDAADQNAAKAEGLSNACSGQSPHNCTDDQGNPASCAWDFAIFNADGSYVSDGTDSRYEHAGRLAESLGGLTWGGRWKYPDFDHIELTGWNAS